MNETLESAQKAKEQLEHWRKSLNDWMVWIESEIADISSGNPSKKTLSLLLQHIALIKPWFQGLMSIAPRCEPDNVPVTRCEYQEPYISTWPQRVTRGTYSGGNKSEPI